MSTRRNPRRTRSTLDRRTRGVKPMSIHATFFDCTAFEYKNYPYDDMKERGHVYLCEPLGSDYIRVSIDEGDPHELHQTNSARVDIHIDQLEAMGAAIQKLLDYRKRRLDEIERAGKDDSGGTVSTQGDGWPTA